MRVVFDEQIIERIRIDNPWWQDPHEIDSDWKAMLPRSYFTMFYELLKKKRPRRAVILMGPRRVGKTIMMQQAIQKLIDDGVAPEKIVYLNLEIPLFNGIHLESLIELALRTRGLTLKEECHIFIDEIQYLKSWEVHLKTAVDSFRNIEFIASGSAAAALRLKSRESGAGRFTEFLLPPLTFYEYLHLLDKAHLAADDSHDIDALNNEFVNYINYGGYPEAIFDPEIKNDPGRFVGRDIIDKVLLRDLPSLYGIQDVQELNSLFTTLAWNTGEEVSLEGLSQSSGVAKNTIKRYVEYLESAFLIRVVHRIDESAKKFQRANYFKVYLTNTCMRSALFTPLKPDDEGFGHVVETAIYSQWFHVDQESELYYARWKNGEVDIVALSPRFKAVFAVEVKWSDAFHNDPTKLSSLRVFMKNQPACKILATTKTISGEKILDDRTIEFVPAGLYCYAIGKSMFDPRGPRVGSGFRE